MLACSAPRSGGLERQGCASTWDDPSGAHREGTPCLQAEGIPGRLWWRAEGQGRVQRN